MVDAYGKPALIDEDSLRFNLSHSRDQALLGVAADEIGVDIEFIDPGVNIDELALTVFTAAEQAHLDYGHRDARCERFFQLWTQKEAYMKARGLGVSLPLKVFDVSGDGNTAADSQCVQVQPAWDDARAWYLHSLPAPHSYVASLASTIQNPLLRHFTWAGPPCI